ncbi:MAG: VWA domain-containing protein [Clostridiales bacterium]|nr:VWA domain-containing protein [Clostridiales bacterium]
MYIEFTHPRVLILLIPAVIWIILSARHLRSRSKSRRAGLVALRCLVIALAVFALSGTSIRKNSDITTTIFLVDLSDSTSRVQGEEAEFVQEAIAAMPEKNQAGIVVFGSDAQIEQFVSEKKAFTDFQAEINGTATNLEQAVQTALALFPEESARRLVLLTDGAENEGSIQNVVSAFSGDGSSDQSSSAVSSNNGGSAYGDTDVSASAVEFKVMQYDSSIEDEVYVSDVTLPDTIRQGEAFQVQVEIYASESGNATVSLYSGRTLKGQQDVVLQKGYNELLFSDEGVEEGLKSYRVTVEAENDTISINNSYSAYTTVETDGRILLVEGEAEESAEFTKILDAGSFSYDVVTPAGVPVKISDLNQYQTVILLDVYADDLRDGFLDIIETYVQDYAGGLIAIGGTNSYALGNYRDTSLETVLPVSMDLEGENEVPQIAMVMVIDHSSSMSTASTENGSITCMEIARQAAISALDSLREIDEVGVIAFNDAYSWAVPLQTAADTDAIAASISGIAADGGTSIYPAVAEAVSALKESDAAIKHIILLTDGEDGYREYGDLLDEIEAEGINLSTVAVGSGSDTKLLKNLATAGGGRYYYSDAGTALPRIFAQEVYLSTDSYLINEEFVPTMVNSHEILSNLFADGSPTLLGYVATTAKSTATVLLESDREDPVLAVWQYGLGRTVAWTTDGTNEWTGNFAQWENYTTLWKNIIDWTISDSELGSDTLDVSQGSSSITIEYTTDDFTTDTEVDAVLTDEDGNQQEVTLKAVSPGQYRVETEVDGTGVYSINLRKSEDGEVVKNVNTAAVIQYSREYRYAEVDSTLDAFVSQVGGRYITEAAEVFDTDLEGTMSRTDITQLLLILALLCFVLDIVARRLHLDWLALVANGVLIPREKVRNVKKVQKKISVPKGQKIWENRKSAGISGDKKEDSSERILKTTGGKKAKKEDRSVEVIDTEALLRKKQDRN